MNNAMNLAKALMNLRPNAQWSIDGDTYEGIIWFKTNTEQLPSKGAIENEIARFLKEEEDYKKANEYKSKRAAEYPPIGDQLDAMWKGGAAAQQMLAKIQEVKAKYPKPAAQEILDALNRK